MKAAKMLAVALLAMVLCSCGAGGGEVRPLTLDDLAKIEIGMTREKVVSIIGERHFDWGSGIERDAYYLYAWPEKGYMFQNCFTLRYYGDVLGEIFIEDTLGRHYYRP